LISLKRNIENDKIILQNRDDENLLKLYYCYLIESQANKDNYLTYKLKLINELKVRLVGSMEYNYDSLIRIDPVIQLR